MQMSEDDEIYEEFLDIMFRTFTADEMGYAAHVQRAALIEEETAG